MWTSSRATARSQASRISRGSTSLGDHLLLDATRQSASVVANVGLVDLLGAIGRLKWRAAARQTELVQKDLASMLQRPERSPRGEHREGAGLPALRIVGAAGGSLRGVLTETGAQAMTSQPSNRLKLDRVADARGVVLTLDGEVDLETAPAFAQSVSEISESNPRHLLIDLHGVEFMDSTGLAAIIAAQRAADANGHDLSLRRGSAQVQRLFELTGLLDRLTFED